MRCASALPLRSTEPGLGAELLGDGFFRIRSNATAALAAVAALAPGEAYAVSYLSPLDEVAGANAWLMNFLNSTTPPSVAFYYDIVRVPDQVWKNGTANKIDLNSYLLDTLGYDCVLDRAVEASDQALYANFLHVSQSFSYVVVGLAPTFTQPSLVSQLFVWAVPFDVAVWAIIVTTFFLSSGLMTWFEDDSPHVLEMVQAMKLDKVKRKERYARLLIQGLYTSFSSFLTQNSDTFVAQSLPGRVYRTFWAFVILLTIFSYLANLSAFMSVLPKPTAVITSVADFTTKGRPACILDQPDDLTFMANNYPNVALIVIPGMHGADLFRAITDPSIPVRSLVMDIAAVACTHLTRALSIPLPAVLSRDPPERACQLSHGARGRPQRPVVRLGNGGPRSEQRLLRHPVQHALPAAAACLAFRPRRHGGDGWHAGCREHRRKQLPDRQAQLLRRHRRACAAGRQPDRQEPLRQRFCGGLARAGGGGLPGNSPEACPTRR